ncbi:TPA: hypothetical protein HA344_00515 [Candidatus Bathyarchaeota archaeon]|nr:hypothetical protein [Candidatus Bathyarchaeota archaeon]
MVGDSIEVVEATHATTVAVEADRIIFDLAIFYHHDLTSSDFNLGKGKKMGE